MKSASDVLSELGRECVDIDSAHGRLTGHTDDAYACALLHAEVSELLETFRDSDKLSEKIPLFSASEEEAADVLLRLLALCYVRGLRLLEAAQEKLNYNGGRPHKHGKKF